MVKVFLVEQILFIQSVWLSAMLFFNDFGRSELMLRKVWWSVFLLNILVCNLFLMYISVLRNEILSFDISCSNLVLMDIFYLTPCKNFLDLF